MFGFLNLNKPRNLGSRTAINAVGKFVRPQKFGHTGTLDPLATGVLVTAIGPATRLSQFVQDAAKEYVGSFRLGFTSNTEDITGDVQPLANALAVSESQLVAVLPTLTGSIEQTPPQFSALKVDGIRAYKLARRGQEAKLKKRSVEIDSLELESFEFPDFQLRIRCSGGTYVRTLGRDLAKAVGSDAVMTELTRTAVGTFRIEDAIRPEAVSPDVITQHIVAPQDAISLERICVTDAEVRQLENAIPLTLSQAVQADQVLAIDGRDRLIALLRKRDTGLFTPKINFAPYWREK